MAEKVFIVRHRVMGGVQKNLCNNRFRKKGLHGIPVIKETDGIVPGGGVKEGENREVIFGIRGSEHVEVITEIVAFPVGIPANVTVGLAVEPVTFAVADAFFQTVTDPFFSFPCGGIDGGAVTGERKGAKINEAFLGGASEKKGFKNVKKEEAGSRIIRGKEFKALKEFFDGNFFHRRSFCAFLGWLFGLVLRRMDGGGKVVLFGEPKPGLKIIKGSNTGSIADGKAGKDGMKKVFLEIRGPFGIGRDLEFHGKEDRAEHVGRKPWFGAEVGIAASHEGIQMGEVKVPEFFDNLPGGRGEGGSSVRIVNRKLS